MFDVFGQGWLKLHRKILKTDIFQKEEWLQLWVYCLCRANHKGTSHYAKGLAEPIKLKPGQFIAGQNEVKKALHSDVNASTIYIWMSKEFTKRGMLTYEVIKGRCTIWTVCNWARYQGPTKRKDKTDAKKENTKGEAGRNGQEEQCFPEIPAGLKAIWRDWENACREAGKPLTPTRVKYQLEKLAAHPPTTQMAMVKLAITNQWSDFFPLKTRKPNANTKRKLGPTPNQQFDEPAPPK